MARNRVLALTPRMLELAGLAPPPAKPKRARRPAELVPDAVAVCPDPARVELTVGVRLGSRANLDGHGHWRDRHRARKELDATLGVLLRAKVPEAVRARLAAGCVIRLGRIAPTRLDSWENLRAALKGVKDVLAVWLVGGPSGRNDEVPQLDWRPPDQWSQGRASGLSVKLWEAGR